MHAPPRHSSYDVVIVGGGIHGSAVAWFTACDPHFDGRILVVERDPTYADASTSHTNSCMRQQFTNPVNVRVSQYAAHFIKTMPERFAAPGEARDERVPRTAIHDFGYMYLAGTPAAAEALRAAQGMQVAAGAGTRHMGADEIAALYPFYHLDDIVAGNHNLVDEGYFDGGTLFDWWRRSGRERGVEFCSNEVVAMNVNRAGTGIEGVRLATGETVACGTVVNASGPRAARTAAMAGIALPVEPRKRYTFVFDAERPLERDLPLTIDPSGVHVRTDGASYMAGCAPTISGGADAAVEPDDFEPDHALWEEHVWPVLAHRVPAFEAIRLRTSWVGHYDMNVFDANAILGRHTRVTNMLFSNGFSGHGLQQSPAMGRGTAELIVHGEYRTLDLSAFDYSRIERGEPFREGAVI